MLLRGRIPSTKGKIKQLQADGEMHKEKPTGRLYSTSHLSNTSSNLAYSGVATYLRK